MTRRYYNVGPVVHFPHFPGTKVMNTENEAKEFVDNANMGLQTYENNKQEWSDYLDS